MKHCRGGDIAPGRNGGGEALNVGKLRGAGGAPGEVAADADGLPSVKRVVGVGIKQKLSVVAFHGLVSSWPRIEILG